MEELLTIEDVLRETDLNNLQQMKFDIAVMIQQAHTDLVETEDPVERTITKGTLTTLYTLKEVCSDKLEMEKERIKSDANQQQRFNYNFRVAAKNLLSKKSYDMLMQYGTLTVKEIKELTEGLSKMDDCCSSPDVVKICTNCGNKSERVITEPKTIFKKHG